MPSVHFLQQLHEGRVLVTAPPVQDDNLFLALTQFPLATFFTFSRQATSHENRIALERIFPDAPLATIQYDCDMTPMPIYRRMKAIISQNRDKKNGVVNGKTATIIHVQDAAIFLHLPSGFIAASYPVSVYRDGQLWTSYPFVPAYALTVAKAQGQTLDSANMWLDSSIVPAGGAYVALARIRKLVDLRFLVETNRFPWFHHENEFRFI